MSHSSQHELPSELESSAPISVLTGATRGIGRHVASAIAGAGHVLVVPGRDPTRSEQLCRDLVAETSNTSIYWVNCDLSELGSVRSAAAQISSATKRIDVLVNNAGHFGGGFEETSDGFERHLAINYLAPFLLTHELLPSLRAASAARVVNVAGETARIGRIRMNDLNRSRKFSVLGAYAQSKLATMLFSRVLAARVASSPMLVNALQPGLAATGHLSAGPRWLDRLWRFMSPKPQRAARAVAALALAANREGTSGRYYFGRLRAFAPFAVYRRKLARTLYNKTADLVEIEASRRLTPVGDGL